MASTTGPLPDARDGLYSLEHENAVPIADMPSTADGGASIDTTQPAVTVLRANERDDKPINEPASSGLEHAVSVANTSSSQLVGESDRQSHTSPNSHQSRQETEPAAQYPAYSNPPTRNDHDDLDSAALLESLASYDQSQVPPTSSLYPDPDAHAYQNNHQHQTNQFENDHFASLLQAAATAGQNQENDHHSHYETQSSRDTQPLQEWMTQGLDAQQQQRSRVHKRKHSEVGPDTSSTPHTHPPSHWNSRSARRKLTNEADDGSLAREHAIWGPESDHNSNESPSPTYTPLSPSSARAAGVHSAAALFRKPTPASKKYTRPPMSKLFTSLELTPEQFLHLQAAAKSYMLDPAHPDRYNCVGSKAKVDSDMVKLKLFGCVETFLEEEGWGEKCWGATSERDSSKSWRLRWPECRNKIITSVTPLMRRMVTNERQRRYAVETRSKDKGGKVAKSPGNTQNAQPGEDSQLPPEIDPKLGDYHYALPESTSTGHDTSLGTSPDLPPATSLIGLKLILVDPSNTDHIIHTSTLPSLPAQESYQHVMRYIDHWLASSELPEQSSHSLTRKTLRAHLPGNFKEVGTAEEWEEAVKILQQTAWMDNMLQVVVEGRHNRRSGEGCKSGAGCAASGLGTMIA